MLGDSTGRAGTGRRRSQEHTQSFSSPLFFFVPLFNSGSTLPFLSLPLTFSLALVSPGPPLPVRTARPLCSQPRPVTRWRKATGRTAGGGCRRERAHLTPVTHGARVEVTGSPPRPSACLVPCQLHFQSTAVQPAGSDGSCPCSVTEAVMRRVGG